MWLLVGVLALPLIEIALFVTLGARLGLWLTLAWVVLTAVLGAVLMRGAAMPNARQMSSEMRNELRNPLSPLAHRLMIGIAGLLLVLPGFFTDALGLLLLLRPVRTLLIRSIGKRMKATVVVRRDVVDGEWRDITPDTGPKLGSPPDGTRH
ncbi:FxsA family protein [Tabrizicola sp.]|uniref:FxsA family protein n=1 Tax=Tabrizicola sp. TaxID=2005166 RepID=UPI003F41A8B2